MGVVRSSRRHVAAFVLVLLLSACSIFNPNPPVLVDPAEARQEEGPDAEPVKRPQPLKPTVRWRNCRKPFQCAKLRVPLDYDRPRGQKVTLALIRLPAPKQNRRMGSLIVNPGGPGGSGVDFVRHAALHTVPAEVRVRFDIVGFDPRGVGRSEALSCGDGAPQSFLARRFVTSTDAEVSAVLKAAQDLATSCGQHGGSLLPHVGTTNVARDLDAIRRAVGDRQLTYLGYSYGTKIGLTYAELFPTKVRALVLDGPVDPAIGGLRRARDQAGVLEKTLREFFALCPEKAACRGVAERLSLRRFDRLIARLNSAPVPAATWSGQRELRSSEALLATALLLKDRGTGWPILAAGIATAERGDGSLLLSVAESSAQPGRGRQQWLAPLLAVNCLDIPAPAPGQYLGAAERLRRESVHFGSLMLLLNSPCSYWPASGSSAVAPVTAPQAPTAVVIGTTGDPTTPFEWAEAVSKNLKRSRLLVRDGAGHTAFGKINVCTDRAVTAYLVDLVLPADRQGCS